eukprot:TRINITY_DN2116_c0_g1_i2.p1 TRINITY_DN2116_c0_g1~~TRINITY_DN2116_c0_g1_i2.p1  ORF type:complete len:632 (-),score=93.77 TRINITY_DN2116_c0_g1_i2:813-2708(-)
MMSPMLFGYVVVAIALCGSVMTHGKHADEIGRKYSADFLPEISLHADDLDTLAHEAFHQPQERVLPGFNFRFLHSNIPRRMKPNELLQVEFEVANIGASDWASGAVSLVLLSNDGFELSRNTIFRNVLASESLAGDVTLKAPGKTGVFWHKFILSRHGSLFGRPFYLRTEVTCSDNIFCNGEERFVDGTCVTGPLPCDDGQSCTRDICLEPRRWCKYERTSDDETCPACGCSSTCDGKQCGVDGCGNPCGECPEGTLCSQTQTCVAADQPGTCSRPITFQQSTGSFFRTYNLEGDAKASYDSATLTCVPSTNEPDVVYQFTVPAGMRPTIVATVTGGDTVIELRSGNCHSSSHTPICEDDTTPPGNYGSQIVKRLFPGTFFIIVEFYELYDAGKFNLEVKFLDDCTPDCNGRTCGSDGCGGVCGPCDEPGSCEQGVCRFPDGYCVPTCENRRCGSDGCGGSCGACQDGSFCLEETRECISIPQCNHMNPQCPQCQADEFCGTDCVCHPINKRLPDLVVHVDEVSIDHTHFAVDDCAVVEQCIGFPGDRKLLRFSTHIRNQGNAPLQLPAPPTRPDLFEYSACHGHYHYQVSIYTVFCIPISKRVFKPMPCRRINSPAVFIFCVSGRLLSPN